jgi:hypothetical protein
MKYALFPKNIHGRCKNAKIYALVPKISKNIKNMHNNKLKICIK